MQVKIDHVKMVPTFVTELDGGGALYCGLEDCLNNLECMADEGDEDLAGFDREAVKQELLWVAIGNGKWERGPWSVRCEWVDPEWLASLPEHDGW